MECEEEFDDNHDYYGFEGVKLFSEIIPPNEQGYGGLYLGKVELAQNYKKLDTMKIGAILSIIGYPLKLDKTKNIQHLFLNADDHSQQNISNHFDTSHKFITENLQKTNVFVHCQMGISRSSSLVIAYLMKERGNSYKEILEFVRNKRTCVSPNSGFELQLKKYEEALLKKEKEK